MQKFENFTNILKIQKNLWWRMIDFNYGKFQKNTDNFDV